MEKQKWERDRESVNIVKGKNTLLKLVLWGCHMTWRPWNICYWFSSVSISLALCLSLTLPLHTHVYTNLIFFSFLNSMTEINIFLFLHNDLYLVVFSSFFVVSRKYMSFFSTKVKNVFIMYYCNIHILIYTYVITNVFSWL